MRALAWIFVVTFAKIWSAEGLKENGDVWKIESNLPTDEFQNEFTSNSEALSRRSNLENTPEMFLIKAETLDRPTREPKENNGNFETLLTNKKAGKSNEAKSKVATGDSNSKTGDNYVLHVSENDLLNDSKEGEVETLPKRSKLSEVTGREKSQPNMESSHVTTQRQDIETSPESFAGESVGKPYGDPDGYQTIGDGIYLMNNEQEKAFSAGTGAQSQGMSVNTDHGITGELGSSLEAEQGREQTGEAGSDTTGKQGADKVNQQTSDTGSDSTGQAATNKEDDTASEDSQASDNTSNQASDKAGEETSGGTGKQTSDKTRESASFSDQAAPSKAADASSDKASEEASDKGSQGSEFTEAGKNSNEPTVSNLNEFLTTLDTGESVGKPGNDQNATTRNSTNAAAETGNASPDDRPTTNTKEQAFASVQSSAPVYGSKPEPSSDIEAVTPKELNILQTFEDGLKREDKQISKVMTSVPVDKKNEAYVAKTNAMIQNFNKEQLDSILDKLKTEDSAFIKKNPYVADKSKLLDAIRNIKYKNMAVTKRGFLSTNDNIPVEKLYNSLLKEDEWLKNGMNEKAELKDSVNEENKESGEGKMNEFLKFSEKADEKIPNELHVQASRFKDSENKATNKKISGSSQSQPQHSSSEAPKRKTGIRKTVKGRKKGRLLQTKILILEPSTGIASSSSKSRSSSSGSKEESAKSGGNSRDQESKVTEGGRNNGQQEINEEEKSRSKSNAGLSTKERNTGDSERYATDSSHSKFSSASPTGDGSKGYQVRQTTANKGDTRPTNRLHPAKKRRNRKFGKVGGKHRNAELGMKDGEMKNVLFANSRKKHRQKFKSSQDKEDKDYYWHGTQKPETRQLPTDPTEVMKKFGQISNMLPPSLQNDLTDTDSKYIGNKNNIASDGTEVRTDKGHDDSYFKDLKEYGNGMKSYHYQPPNKINENDISSTSFFSASKSSGGSPTPKVFEKEADNAISPTLVQDAVKEIESKDMQDVKGYIDRDASKTLAFFDQNSLQPKIEEFDDVRKAHLKADHERHFEKPKKSRKKVRVVLHLPELGEGGVHDIHGKDSDDPIGSIKAITTEFSGKARKKPSLGQELADDDEDTLEELLSKPTAKLIQFRRPTTASSSEVVPENSVGQETKDWSKETEDKETVPMEGSDVYDSREKNEMASAFTGKNILNLIKSSEEGFKDDLSKEAGDEVDDSHSDDDIGENFENQKTGRKKQTSGKAKKQRYSDKNRLQVLSHFDQDNPDQPSEVSSDSARDDTIAPNIYADQIKYEQKQREVSELMPTEAVNQIKAILSSDENINPLKFLEKDRQLLKQDLHLGRQESEELEHGAEAAEPKQDNEGVYNVAYSKPKISAVPQTAKVLDQDSNPVKAKPRKQPTSKANAHIANKNIELNPTPENLLLNPDVHHSPVISNLLPSSRKIQIQGGKILGGKILGGRILGGKIGGGLIKGGLVEGGDIEGGAVFGGKVEGGVFRNGRMENGVLYNGTVEGGVIKGGEIYGGKMVSGLIAGGKLKGGSINGGKLTGGEIDGGSLKSGEIQGGFLREGSVEGGLLKGGSIEGGHLLGGVMLGGRLKGGIVKSGIIRGGIIEGGVVEGGVIDNGDVIKGGVTRGYSGDNGKSRNARKSGSDEQQLKSDEKSPENKEKSTEKNNEKSSEKKEREATEKHDDKYQSSVELSHSKTSSESPLSMYKINVDEQNTEEHSVEPTSQDQGVGDSSDGQLGDHDPISILGAPESWPVKNKDLGNTDNSKHKVAPVTYANSVQPRPKPVPVKEQQGGGGKIASTSKLRELLKDLDKGNSGQPKKIGGKDAEEFHQMTESDGAATNLYMFKRPTVSALGLMLGGRDNMERNFGTTTRTIQAPSKKPAALKYHWSLNSVRGGKILGSPGKDMSVIGGVKIHNGIATMNDGLIRGYLDAGDFQGECLSDPDVCKNGLTVSITNKIHKDSIESPTRMYLFDSGAGSEDSRGMALWVNRGKIEGAVSTRKGTWCLREDIRPFSDKWVDLLMTWKPNQGLYLFANCELLAVSGFGTGCDVCKKSFCHQTDSNTHFMIARPNKGPHFKLTHFSSGDISVYEDFFTIDGVKEHCGTNNDYLRKNPYVPPARAIVHIPIKSPWDSSSIVMKKENTYGRNEFINPGKTDSSDSDDEFQVWPTPSGLHALNKVVKQLGTDVTSKASSRQDVKVDGGYSEWTSWTPCSGACGGTSMAVRYCNNPVPKLDGKGCSVIGPARRTRICSPVDCLDTSKKTNVERNNFKASQRSDISKRKEITRNQPTKVNQHDDLNQLQKEFEILKSR